MAITWTGFSAYPNNVVVSSQSTIWSDLSNSLNTDANGNVQIVTEEESIRESVENILGTFVGERVMLRNFGASLQQMLFEPMDDKLKDIFLSILQKEIAKWDDRPVITDIDVVFDPDTNSIAMTLALRVQGTNNSFTMSLLV